MLLSTIIVYVLLQIAIAAWFARGTRSDADYLVAGRRLGTLAVAMSLFATWFAAETVIATSAEVAEHGLAGARVEPFAYGFGLVVLGLFIAFRLRAGGYLSVAAFMGDRFGRGAETLSALVVAAGGTIWASAQLFALATLVAASSDLPFLLALVGATTVVLAYTLIGGLIGDVATDIIQGAILAIGIGVLLVLALDAAGGLSSALAAIPPERLTLSLPDEHWLERVELWIIPVVGTIAAQEAISRTLAARSPEVARRGALAGAGLYVAIGLIPVLLGFLGPQLGLALGEGDEFLPSLATVLLPDWLYVVFVGALLSAILSSVDSALLAVSAVLTESGYRRVRPGMGRRESLWAARACTVAAGVIAFLIAAAGSGLRELVLAASAVTGAYAVALVLGLSTRRGGPRAGFASVATALMLLVVLNWIHPLPGGFLMAMVGGAIAYAAVGAAEGRQIPAVR